MLSKGYVLITDLSVIRFGGEGVFGRGRQDRLHFPITWDYCLQLFLVLDVSGYMRVPQRSRLASARSSSRLVMNGRAPRP